MQNLALKSCKPRCLFLLCYRNFLTRKQQCIKMIFYITNRFIVAYPHTALKVGDKASVVHINRAHSCDFIIGYKKL